VGIADRMPARTPKRQRPLKKHELTRHCRPIMTIVSENPDKAFVKGGLFRKFGVDLPRPVLQLFMRRREAWERGVEGIKSLD
jgi:hypothetical protein